MGFVGFMGFIGFIGLSAYVNSYRGGPVIAARTRFVKVATPSMWYKMLPPLVVAQRPFVFNLFVEYFPFLATFSTSLPEWAGPRS